jgi:NitT/TauT family transport system substrate-binding protein
MSRLSGRFRVLGVAATATTAALLAAGCSGSGGSGAVGGLEKTNLTVAAVPAVDSAGLYIAQQRGFFAQEGLHVKILPAISSADVIAKQEKGLFDVTSGAYPSYILADVDHHANFKVLVAGSTMAPNTQEIVVPSGSKITKMSQLAGQTIGVNALNNVGTLLVSSMLQDNAVPAKGPGGRPTRFKVIQFPDMGKALAEHQVAAAWLPEPFITADEEQFGVQPLADANQGAAENLPIAGYVVTQAWLQKYPHTAEAFRIALDRAQAVANSNLSAVQKAMTEFAGVPPLAASVLAAPGFPTDTQAGPLQRVVTLMVNFNLINQGYNAQNLVARIPGTS